MRLGDVAVKKIAVTASILLLASLAACSTSGAAPSAASTPAASSPASVSESASASVAPTASPATGSASPVQSASSGANTITLTEWKVALPTTMKAGKVDFTINNAGAIEHELIAFRSDLDPKSFPRADGDIDENGNGIVQVTDGDDIAAGGTQTRTIDLTKPGKYVFLCNIPGHFLKGMYAVVTVTK